MVHFTPSLSSAVIFCRMHCVLLPTSQNLGVLTAMWFEFPPVPQPPTITLQSSKDYIFDPRENIIIRCEAKGKPHPRYTPVGPGLHVVNFIKAKLLRK